MSNGEFLGTGVYRVGYLKPLGQPWRPVLCSVVNDHLIFQGCIIVGKVAEMDALADQIRQRPELLSDPDAQLFGVVIKGQQYRWKDKTIPYEIDAALPNKQRVEEAIKHWREKTDLTFKVRTSEADWIAFVPVAEGCASHVGRQGGRQEIWLSDACSKGNVIHEVGHAVGFWHEQSRADRDKHIDIVWANIDPRFRHNFEQHIDDGIDVGTYDYGSIMHYPAKAFSVNGKETIKPKKDGVTIGQRTKLSEGDIKTAKQIYS